MGKKRKKRILLEEKKEISYKDLVAKIKRLDGYIKKAERRITVHEKALVKLREKIKKEIQKAIQGVILKGKIYG